MHDCLARMLPDNMNSPSLPSVEGSTFPPQAMYLINRPQFPLARLDCFFLFTQSLDQGTLCRQNPFSPKSGNSTEANNQIFARGGRRHRRLAGFRLLRSSANIPGKNP